MAAPGVTIVKSFNYRGQTEEWSNQYHFVGSAPSNPSDWQSLLFALIGLEYLALTTLVTYVRAYGYTDTDHDAVYTFEDLAGFGPHATGNLAPGSGPVAPGDAAAWIRWKTARLTSRGKPIYLRKYYHSVLLAGTSPDTYDHLSSAHSSALGTLAGALNGAVGAWPGIAGPDGVAPGTAAVSPFVTTRTLKRRGPRP